jgi:hypothetical protein
LCDQLDETTDHLLCSCVFVREVWSRLLSSLGFLAATPTQDNTLLGWWFAARATFPQALRRSFNSLVLLVPMEGEEPPHLRPSGIVDV